MVGRWAKDFLLKKLKDGKSFSELAEKSSSCSSRSKGGDLGPIGLGRADADFEEAALDLKVGEVSNAPIRTRFGYHLIKRLA